MLCKKYGMLKNARKINLIPYISVKCIIEIARKYSEKSILAKFNELM